MRLGLYPARLTPGSKAAAVYGQEVIYERHRHRFEVNNRYRQTLESAGLLLSGQSPDGRLVEIVELKDHPWFVASQFHPEFKSRPERPHVRRRGRCRAPGPECSQWPASRRRRAGFGRATPRRFPAKL
jgi:CTP synthase